VSHRCPAILFILSAWVIGASTILAKNRVQVLEHSDISENNMRLRAGCLEFWLRFCHLHVFVPDNLSKLCFPY
jgi:hypothetical protein